MARQVRKFIILLLGISVLLVGVLMILLPGPAFLVIPAGLAILASEFIWARNALQKVKEKISQSLQRIKKNN